MSAFFISKRSTYWSDPDAYPYFVSMINNWLTLRALADYLDRSLSGSIIVSVFSQSKDELVVDLKRGNSRYSLRVSVTPHLPFILPSGPFARARRNTVDIFPEVIGKSIRAFEISRTDRVLRMSLGNGALLFFQLYPAKANIFFHDVEETRIRGFKVRIPFDVSGNEFGNSPAVIDSERFRALSAPASNSLFDGLKLVAPFLSGTIAREIVFRSGITSVASDEQARLSLRSSIGQVMAEVAEDKYFMYRRDGRTHCFSIVQCTHLSSSDEITFSNFADALNAYISSLFRERDFIKYRQSILTRLVRERQSIAAAQAKQPTSDELNRSANDFERRAQLLLAQPNVMDRHESPIAVTDVFEHTDAAVSIDLDPVLTLAQNAELYFKKAKRVRSSSEIVTRRTAGAKKNLTRIEAVLERIQRASSMKQLRLIMEDKDNSVLDSVQGKRDDKVKQIPFRRFVVTGGFEVWVGKSSASNDELTTRYAKPNDMWFHARGVGGSHVVLKIIKNSKTPGREAIRDAASIAAYYSKYRKAGTVPVAYTEKKYVRKPKGAPSGTVVLDREKVILVSPKLPVGTDTEDSAEYSE